MICWLLPGTSGRVGGLVLLGSAPGRATWVRFFPGRGRSLWVLALALRGELFAVF